MDCLQVINSTGFKFFKERKIKCAIHFHFIRQRRTYKELERLRGFNAAYLREAAGLRIWVFRYSYTITNTCVNIISTSGTLKFFDFNAAATQIQ